MVHRKRNDSSTEARSDRRGPNAPVTLSVRVPKWFKDSLIEESKASQIPVSAIVQDLLGYEHIAPEEIAGDQ